MAFRYNYLFGAITVWPVRQLAAKTTIGTNRLPTHPRHAAAYTSQKFSQNFEFGPKCRDRANKQVRVDRVKEARPDRQTMKG